MDGKLVIPLGAWSMTREYLNGKVSPDGRCTLVTDCGYKLDRRLVPCLADVLDNMTVTELGAGTGHYMESIMQTKRIRNYTAYDGVPNIETLTAG